MPAFSIDFAQLGDLLAGLAFLAQLLADLVQLFAQQRFLVTLVDRFARLLFELALEAQHFDALGQQLGDAIEARLEIDGLEQLLLLGRLDVHEARDQVGERRRRLDRLDRVRELGRRLRQQRDGLGRQTLQVQRARFDLAGVVDVSVRYSTRATMKGRPLCQSSTRKRRSPCTTR